MDEPLDQNLYSVSDQELLQVFDQGSYGKKLFSSEYDEVILLKKYIVIM